MSIFTGVLRTRHTNNTQGYAYNPNRTEPSSNRRIFNTYFGDIEQPFRLNELVPNPEIALVALQDFRMQVALVSLVGIDNWINNVDEIARGELDAIPQDILLLELFEKHREGFKVYLQVIADRLNTQYHRRPALAQLGGWHLGVQPICNPTGMVSLLPYEETSSLPWLVVHEVVEGGSEKPFKDVGLYEIKGKVAVGVVKGCLVNLAQDYIDYISTDEPYLCMVN